jgi:hypothetical protein
LSAQRYRKQAAQQRKIASSIPLASLRQRFLASAERYERLAQAEEELSWKDHPDGPFATD